MWVLERFFSFSGCRFPMTFYIKKCLFLSVIYFIVLPGFSYAILVHFNVLLSVVLPQQYI